jgi:hypothetical protein
VDYDCICTLVQLFWEGETELLAENPATVPHCTWRISHRMTRNLTWDSGVKGQGFRVRGYAEPYLHTLNRLCLLIVKQRNSLFADRSQWPSGLRRGSAADRLLGLLVRIPPGTWMCVYCECCVLSGRGVRDRPITSPEKSYRLCCVLVCDLETSRIRRLKPASGL